MFDIGWSEILVIAMVAILVVGPKELPRMLRSFGKTMGTVRRTANDFKRQFEEALREAEREAGLEDTKKQLQAIAKSNPLKNEQKQFDDAMRTASKPVAPEPKSTSSPAPAKESVELREAEPLKTGAAPQQGSDAA